jgi:hypothetical protein
MINAAISAGARLSLPDAVSLLDSAYLGHVIVLWSWALRQPAEVDSDDSRAPESVTVRFQSLDGQDRAMEVPRLMFTEPISTLLGAAT